MQILHDALFTSLVESDTDGSFTNVSFDVAIISSTMKTLPLNLKHWIITFNVRMLRFHVLPDIKETSYFNVLYSNKKLGEEIQFMSNLIIVRQLSRQLSAFKIEKMLAPCIYEVIRLWHGCIRHMLRSLFLFTSKFVWFSSYQPAKPPATTWSRVRPVCIDWAHAMTCKCTC